MLPQINWMELYLKSSAIYFKYMEESILRHCMNKNKRYNRWSTIRSTRLMVSSQQLTNWWIFSEATQTPFSQPQCINLAYRILNCTGLFQRWIIDWNNRPQVQKTWKNFKVHFRTVHQQLKETTNLQVRDSSYHANAIKEVIQELRSELQNQLNSKVSDQESLPLITSLSENSTDSTISALQTEVASLKDFIHNTIQPAHQITVPWAQPYCMSIHLY